MNLTWGGRITIYYIKFCSINSHAQCTVEMLASAYLLSMFLVFAVSLSIWYDICVCVTSTLSLYHNSSVWLDIQDISSWDWNPPNFVGISILPLSLQATYATSRIIMHYVLVFVCLHFALLDTRVLSVLEELCITRLAAVNFFARVLNPQVGSVCVWYIYIHTHTHTHSNKWKC